MGLLSETVNHKSRNDGIFFMGPEPSTLPEVGAGILAIGGVGFAAFVQGNMSSCYGALIAGIFVVASPIVPVSEEYSRLLNFFNAVIPFTLSFGIGVLFAALAVRIAATVLHIPAGLRALPDNFRRLVFCTSPAQEPELVPGLEPEDTQFTLNKTVSRFRYEMANNSAWENVINLAIYPLIIVFWNVPGWLYRFSIKSTSWFWWPLAFLGADLQVVKRPGLMRQRTIGTLWSKASIGLAAVTLIAFLVTTLFANAESLRDNPFLTVFGLVFLLDWSFRPWQFLAILMAALSVVMVFAVDAVDREYQYAMAERDDEMRIAAVRKLGWIERLARFRFLCVLIFWLMVGMHAFLYFNAVKCWTDVPANVGAWAHWIYGDRLPPRRCI